MSRRPIGNAFALCCLAAILALLAGCTSSTKENPEKTPREEIKLAVPDLYIDLCAAMASVPELLNGKEVPAREVDDERPYPDMCVKTLMFDNNNRNRGQILLGIVPPPKNTAEPKVEVSGYLGWRSSQTQFGPPKCQFSVPLASGESISLIGTFSSQTDPCDSIDKIVREVFSRLEKQAPVFLPEAKLLRLAACSVVSTQTISQITGQSVDKSTPLHAQHSCEWELSNKTKVNLSLFNYVTSTEYLDRDNSDYLGGKQVNLKDRVILADRSSACSASWYHRNGPSGAEYAEFTVSGTKDVEQCRALAAATIPDLPAD